MKMMRRLSKIILKSYCFDPQGGALLISLIAAMLLMSILSIAVLSLTSTTQMQGVASNMALNAYYLAESGYRYSASQYKKVANENIETVADDLSADDDKADFLENYLDNKTFTLPDNKGKFKIDLYPYWFVFGKRNGILELKLPGQVPKGFEVPSKGRLKIGDEVDSPVFFPYTNGSVDGAGVFSCSELTSAILAQYQGVAAYPVLQAKGTQANTENLALSCTTPELFPLRNGRILINKTYSVYTKAEFDNKQNLLTLTGLSTPVSVSKDDFVILKKFLQLKSTGIVGEGNQASTREISYSIPVGDSKEEAVPIDIALNKKEDFDKNFAKANTETVNVSEVQTAGGGKTIMAHMKGLAIRTDNGETNNYQQGSFLLNKKDLMNDSWKQEHLLNYDVQVKLSYLNKLLYAGSGIEFRKKYVETYSGKKLYQGFGISFLKYYSPSLTFANGKRQIKNGDWIYYYNQCNGTMKKLTKAQVDGDPEITGDWSSGNAAGRLMLKNSSLEILEPGCESPEYFKTNEKIWNDGHEELATVTVVDIAAGGFNDFIPDSIKPPGMGTWLHWDPNNNNPPPFNKVDAEGDRLLLVLWQQKVEGDVEKRRWLAYKDMTHDKYIMGKQDTWDGRIVNDETTLIVRVREDHIGNDKVNEIEVFYGDSSQLTSYSKRKKNQYMFDIMDNRMTYLGGFARPDQSAPAGGWKALWPPKNLKYWAISYDKFDYFSHIEKPGADSNNPETFQWDGLLSDNCKIDSWDGGGQSIFVLQDQGKIIISDFTTPDSGDYEENEVALGSFFDFWHDGRKDYFLSFSDFSIRIFSPGEAYGAFLNAVQN